MQNPNIGSNESSAAVGNGAAGGAGQLGGAEAMMDEHADNGDVTIAREISIRGIVQGVGLRPFVYRLATRLGLVGWVQNNSAGVTMVVQGAARDVHQFSVTLRHQTPPAARVVTMQSTDLPCRAMCQFAILESDRQYGPTARMTPDLALCDDCRRELLDPRDRRFQYPYINCTHCGPRYSIITSLPYDRSSTTMDDWQMCDVCRQEYESVEDRRYHAQPIACAVCGPEYQWFEGPPYSQVTAVGREAVHQAAQALKAGRILALKGIGGYHLVCDATCDLAVSELRARKYRKERPFALMVRSLSEAMDWALLNSRHQQLLTSVERPIVVAPSARSLPLVVAGQPTLGMMLPYAPVHDLLFAAGAPAPLVMTSGNRSNEPLVYRDDQAVVRLGEIADSFLIGERPIARRVDDSVVTVVAERSVVIRRGRGYAPSVVAQIPWNDPILALGSDLKNSIALAVDGEVFISPHIGDLDDYETFESFTFAIDDLLKIYQLNLTDVVVVHDLHPEYRSVEYALSVPSRQRIAVQHHRAHVASVLAEHELWNEPVLGIAGDGTGYGSDGTIWGCEFFHGTLATEICHIGGLQRFLLPGGDAAARLPVQAAAGLLWNQELNVNWFGEPFRFPRSFDIACQMAKKGVRSFPTSSLGRLFDAVAALLGFTRAMTFEGQAAMWLESQAWDAAPQFAYEFAGLDPRPMLGSIVADRLAGRPIAEIARAFHRGVALGLVSHALRLMQDFPAEFVAVSGGVFQNRLLVELLQADLAERSTCRLLINEVVPTNDGGLSLGQAALAAAMLASGRANGG